MFQRLKNWWLLLEAQRLKRESRLLNNRLYAYYGDEPFELPVDEYEHVMGLFSRYDEATAERICPYLFIDHEARLVRLKPRRDE